MALAYAYRNRGEQTLTPVDKKFLLDEGEKFKTALTDLRNCKTAFQTAIQLYFYNDARFTQQERAEEKRTHDQVFFSLSPAHAKLQVETVMTFSNDDEVKSLYKSIKDIIAADDRTAAAGIAMDNLDRMMTSLGIESVEIPSEVNASSAAQAATPSLNARLRAMISAVTQNYSLGSRVSALFSAIVDTTRPTQASSPAAPQARANSPVRRPGSPAFQFDGERQQRANATSSSSASSAASCPNARMSSPQGKR